MICFVIYLMSSSQAGNIQDASIAWFDNEDAAVTFLDNLLPEIISKDEYMLIDSIDDDDTECDSAIDIEVEPPTLDFKMQVDHEIEVENNFFVSTYKTDTDYSGSVFQFGRMETDNDFFVFNFDTRISPHFTVFDFGQMEVDDGLFVFNFKEEHAPLLSLGHMEVDADGPVCSCSPKKIDPPVPVFDFKEELARGIIDHEHEVDDDDDPFDTWSPPMEEIVDDFNSDLLRLEVRHVVASLQALDISDLDISPIVNFNEGDISVSNFDDLTADDDDNDDDTSSDIYLQLPVRAIDHDFSGDFFHEELVELIERMQTLNISGFESATSWASITDVDHTSPEIAHTTVDTHVSKPEPEPVDNIVSVVSPTPSPVFRRKFMNIWHPMINMEYAFSSQNILSSFGTKINRRRRRRHRKKCNIKTRVSSTATFESASDIYAARCAASAQVHEGRVTTRTHAEEEDKEQVARPRLNEDEITILASACLHCLVKSISDQKSRTRCLRSTHFF